jgi:hypothetical protein
MDGMLTGRAGDEMRAHAAHCPLCGRTLRDFTVLSTRLQGLRDARCDVDLASIVGARLPGPAAPRRKQQRRWSALWNFAPTGLAGAAALGVGAYLGLLLVVGSGTALRPAAMAVFDGAPRRPVAGLPLAHHVGDDMRRSWLLYAFIMSLPINVGVIGAAGYRRLDATSWTVWAAAAWRPPQADAEQRPRWQEIERSFVRELDSGWREIARHRELMIREVFSEHPDRARIEAERGRIAELQSVQQQRVIAQFLRERDILTTEQRGMLVELLLHEEPPTPRERQLHEE